MSKKYYGKSLETLVAEGLVVLTFTHGDGENHGRVIICENQDQVAEENIDNRGDDLYSMASERWSHVVTSIDEIKGNKFITRTYEDEHELDYLNESYFYG